MPPNEPVKRPTGEGNRALLGLDEYSAPPATVQLPDGSFVEMDPEQQVAYEKLDALQRQQLADKLAAKQELEEFEALRKGGSDPHGREVWSNAMTRLGRRV